MVERCKEGDGHPEKSEEYEFSEDSDCESDYEPTSKSDPTSGNPEVGRGGEQKPLPVLKVGSLVA